MTNIDPLARPCTSSPLRPSAYAPVAPPDIVRDAPRETFTGADVTPLATGAPATAASATSTPAQTAELAGSAPARPRPDVPVTLQGDDDTVAHVAPARSEAMARAWRQSSDQYCEQVGEWARRITADEVKPDDFQRASQVLARVSTEAPYPLAREIARKILTDRVKWGDPVTDWTYKMGAVEGPTHYVDEMARRASSTWHQTWFSAGSGVEAFVDALADACGDAAVPAEPLKALAHSAFVWQQRADTVTDNDIRAKEPVSYDEGLAERCAAVVETWWRNGQVEVRQDGRPVPLGFDLAGTLRKERAAVTDGAIDLASRPAPRAQEVVAQAADICQHTWKSNDEPVSKGLAALRALPPDRAREVAAAVVDGAESLLRRDASGLARLMIDAADDPAVAALFRPHLDRITHLVSGAHARGQLAPDNLVGTAHADLITGISKMFPEAVNEELVRRELGPLLREDEPNTQNRAAEVASALLEQRPALSDAVADAILTGDGARDEACWRVLEKAVEKHGWVPTTDQMTDIARSAWAPPSRGYSVFGGTVGANNFRGVLRLLNQLKKTCPQVLEGINLPDTRYHMVPLADALFDRLWNDPNDDPVRRLYARSGYDSGITTQVYGLVFPDATRTEALLDRVAGAIATGQHVPAYASDGRSKALDTDTQKALVVLMSAPLAPAQRARLEALVLPQVYERQGHYAFDELMEPLRTKARESALARLGHESSGPEVLRSATEVLLLHRCSRGAALSTPTQQQTRLETAIGDALARVPGPDLAVARDARLDALAARLQGKPLDAFSDAEVADLQVLRLCADKDGAFDAALHDVLRPHCASRLYDNRIGPLLQELRKEQRQLGVERLAKTDLPRTERLALVQSHLDMARADHRPEDAARVEAVGALASGIGRTAGLEDMLATLRTPDNVFTVYGDLAPGAGDAQIAEEWPRFKDIVTRVGGERFLDDPRHLRGALDVHRYVEERTAAGESRAVALEHGLGCHLMGWDPRTTPPFAEALAARDGGQVEQGEAGVRIGGVLIPKRPKA